MQYFIDEGDAGIWTWEVKPPKPKPLFIPEKKPEMRENILALLLAGHDVGFNATINLYTNDGEKGKEYWVEIYDPVDDDTQELMHNTFKGCQYIQQFYRRGDYWENKWLIPEQAITVYLLLVDFMQSPRPQTVGTPSLAATGT